MPTLDTQGKWIDYNADESFALDMANASDLLHMMKNYELNIMLVPGTVRYDFIMHILESWLEFNVARLVKSEAEIKTQSEKD